MKKIILMLIVLYLSMSLFAGVQDNDQQKLIDEYYFYNNWKKYDKAISAMEQYLQENSSSFYLKKQSKYT
jgi:hypothetical protein